MLAVGGDFGLALIDTANGARVKHLKVPTICRLAAAPTGERLAAVDVQGALHIVDLDSGAEIQVLQPGGKCHTCCVAYSPNGELLAAGGHGGALHVLDTNSCAQLAVLVLGPFSLRCVGFNSSSERIAAGDDGGILYVLDAIKGAKLAAVRVGGLAGPVVDNFLITFAWDPRDDRLVVGDVCGTLHFYHADSGRKMDTLDGDTGAWIKCIAYSPLGESLAIGDGKGFLSLRDGKSNGMLWSFQLSQRGLSSAVFSPCGKIIAVGGTDGTLHIRDALNGVAVRTLHVGITHVIFCLGFVPTPLAITGQSSSDSFWTPSANFLQRLLFPPDVKQVQSLLREGAAGEDVGQSLLEEHVQSLLEEENPVDGFSTADREKMSEHAERHTFHTSLRVIIDSLYTDKQVFLRELIANAADALERARYYSDVGRMGDMEVKIEHDPEAKTISIIDNGIGMTKEDLIRHLGKVGESATADFLNRKCGSVNLIGRFGLGFYSAFLVADKVSVTSKCNDEDKQHVWESSGDMAFTVVDDPRGNTLRRGSRVTLYMKEDSHDYLSEVKLKELASKYSRFLEFPVSVQVRREVGSDGDNDRDGDEDTSDERNNVNYEYEFEQVNSQRDILFRGKQDVTVPEYMELHKELYKDPACPLAYTHFHVECDLNFRGILYLPSKTLPIMMQSVGTKTSEVKLYVRRMLVAESFEILPRYLNFVRGVVDCDDRPVHTSGVSKHLVCKVLELMRQVAEQGSSTNSCDGGSRWRALYQEYGANLKIGCCQEDDTNRRVISKLLRFSSTKSGDKEISLDSYLGRMQTGQQTIYYMPGYNLEATKKSPSLLMYQEKNIEVLLLSDPIDESCLQKIREYEGKKFVSIQNVGVNFDETVDGQTMFLRLKHVYQPLTDWWAEKLFERGAMTDAGFKLDRVQLSERLTNKPVAIVTSQTTGEDDARQEASIKDQYGIVSGPRILEVNPDHPVNVDLLKKVKANRDDASALDTAILLFQTALIESGYEIVDPSVLVNRVYCMLSKEIGSDSHAPMKEVQLAEPI